VWWKTEDVSEVEMEREQTSILLNACFEDKLVPPTTETLGEDGFDIVASLGEKARRSGAEVLVQLESHAALLPGKSTYRSRLISARRR
jgi:hypothetical protein